MKARMMVFAYSERTDVVDLTFHPRAGEDGPTTHVLSMSRLEARQLKRAIEDALALSKANDCVEHVEAFKASIRGTESSLSTFAAIKRPE